VRVGDITEDEARRAGADSLEVLQARLARRTAGRYGSRATFDVQPDLEVWRVDFHRVVDDAPRLADVDQLSAEDVAEIDRRLARLDAASSTGPWTAITLALIVEQPAVVSTRLAEVVGRERQAFKVDVRKLKRLGLTESLLTGYRLSPRGRAYLAATSRGTAGE
jgi:hypothetical protein